MLQRQCHSCPCCGGGGLGGQGVNRRLRQLTVFVSGACLLYFNLSFQMSQFSPRRLSDIVLEVRLRRSMRLGLGWKGPLEKPRRQSCVFSRRYVCVGEPWWGFSGRSHCIFFLPEMGTKILYKENWILTILSNEGFPWLTRSVTVTTVSTTATTVATTY